MKAINGLRAFLVTLALAGSAAATPAFAAVPNSVAVEGRLMAVGGGPVADGQYDVEFALYVSKDAAAPVWKETAKALGVKGGVFGCALGAAAPLTPDVVAGVGAGGVWLGVKVGADPEVGRKAVASAPYALRAAVAEGLACSGCVSAGMLDAQVLAPYAKKAELPDVVKTGSYGDLNNLPVLAKVGTSCGSGMVVKGLKADGSLDCAAGAVVGGKCGVGEVVVEVKADGGVVCAKTAIAGGKCKVGEVVTEVKADGSVVCGAVTATLPPDGLAAVSNGLLTNVFDEVYASKTLPKDIADNNPGGILDEIVIPETGTVKAISVEVEISSSDISQLTVVLFDPENNAYKLHDKSGAGTSLKTSFPLPTKTVSGDLTTWIGKNPKGTWRLVVTDWKASGKATDGQLVAWAVNLKVLSTVKVAATSAMLPAPNATACAAEQGTTGYIVFRCGGKIVGAWWGGREKILDFGGFAEPVDGNWIGVPWTWGLDGYVAYKGAKYGPFAEWVTGPAGGCGRTALGEVICVGKVSAGGLSEGLLAAFKPFSGKYTHITAGNGSFCALAASGIPACQVCNGCATVPIPSKPVEYFRAHAGWPASSGVTIFSLVGTDLTIASPAGTQVISGIATQLTNADYWLKVDGSAVSVVDGSVKLLLLKGFNVEATKQLVGQSYFPCAAKSVGDLTCFDQSGVELSPSSYTWYPEAQGAAKSGTLVQLLGFGYVDVDGNRHVK